MSTLWCDDRTSGDDGHMAKNLCRADANVLGSGAGDLQGKRLSEQDRIQITRYWVIRIMPECRNTHLFYVSLTKAPSKDLCGNALL